MAEYKYVDIIAIKNQAGQTVMRTAPAFSYLEQGDEVMFRLSKADPNDYRGTVVASATLAPDSKEYALLKAFFGEDLSAPVTYKVTYTPLFETEEDRDLASGE